MAVRAEGVAATHEPMVQTALTLGLAQPYEDITLAAIAKRTGTSHQTAPVLKQVAAKEPVAAAAADFTALRR